jgi:cytoskeletal protein RodZ
MSCLAMSGIGCLVIIVAIFLGGGAVLAKFWPQIQEWVAEAESNPEKAAAKLGIKVMPGSVIIREDDAKSEFTFKIGADGEEMTMNYKDIQNSRKPVITNSKGEVIQLPANGKADPAPAASIPAPAPAAPAPTPNN